MVKIIMFGSHTEGWRAALGEGAPVWEMIGATVRTLPGQSAEELREVNPSDEETVVIPLMEKHIIACPREYRSLFPSKEAVTILGNKKTFSAYLLEHDLGHFAPREYNSTDVAFPCVIKRLDLNAGTGVEVVRDSNELSELLGHETFSGHPYLLQEFVSSEFDFVTHAVCKAGKIEWACTYRLTIDPPGAIQRPNNTVSISKVEISPQIVEKLQSLIAPLNYDGPVNFDYKIASDDQFRIIEVNPRLGGSLVNPAHLDDLAEALRTICEHSFK